MLFLSKNLIYFFAQFILAVLLTGNFLLVSLVLLLELVNFLLEQGNIVGLDVWLDHSDVSRYQFFRLIDHRLFHADNLLFCLFNQSL